MIKLVRMLILWMFWETKFSKSNNIKLGIGNFPIPDLKQQFISSENLEFAIEVSNKQWEIYFDMKIDDKDFLTIHDNSKYFFYFKIIKFTDSNRRKFKMSYVKPKHSEIDLASLIVTKEKLVRVRIIKKKDLTFTIDDQLCEKDSNNEFPENALSSSKTFIQFDATLLKQLMITNVLLFDKEIEYLVDKAVNVRELTNINTRRLFKTFRILFDLKIKDESLDICTIFSLNTKDESLFDVSFKQSTIKYCYYPNTGRKECKDFDLKSQKWMYFLIEQWEENNKYYNSFQIWSEIHDVTKNAKWSYKTLVTQPQFNDIHFKPIDNVDVEIRKLIIFNPATNIFGVIQYKGKLIYEYGWTEKNSKVVCRMLGFKDTKILGETFVLSEEILNLYKSFEYIAEMYNCDGAEESLDKCKNNSVVTENMKPAAIICTKWPESKIYDTLHELLLTGTNIDVIRSLENYVTKLSEKFEKWSCNFITAENQYICSVENIISEALRDLKDHLAKVSNKSVSLSEKHNLQKFLEFEFFKQNFDSLKDEIFKTRESIGKYFRNLADFDNQLANHDLTYACDIWDNANILIKEKEDNLINSLEGLKNYGIGVQTGNLLFYTAKLAVQMTGRLNPIKWLTDTDGGIIDPIETTTKLTNAGADIIEIELLFSNSKHALENILAKSSLALAENKATFIKINKILQKAKVNKNFTYEDSKTFLSLYGNYKPAVEQNNIDDYSGIVKGMLNIFLEKIKDKEVSLALTASQYGEYYANNVNMAIELLFGQYEVVKEKQSEIMEAFARCARSMIAKESAEDIINDNGGTKLQKELKFIKGVYLARLQKLRLYTDLCNIYTYKNHGTQISDCRDILADPDISSFRLLSYNSLPDMCSNSEMVEKLVLIPLTMKGNFTMGILSSNELFRYYPLAGSAKNEWVINGSTYFKVPNKKYLVDHGWISNENKGPFFLKKLDLYLPPEAVSSSFSYDVKIQLQTTFLNEISYSFESKIRNKVSYNGDDCLTTENNPYRIQGCKTKLPKLCILTSGLVDSEFLPVLENSVFQITLQSKTSLTKLYPVNKMYLKANVKFCSKINEIQEKVLQRNEQKQDIVKRNAKDLSCCDDDNQYFDILNKTNSYPRIAETKNFCVSCPNNSKAKLFSYFCQKCPDNFEESKEWFGCVIKQPVKPKKKTPTIYKKKGIDKKSIKKIFKN
nr:uncharacterized protein LOC105844197 [Hydra vulgaris]